MFYTADTTTVLQAGTDTGTQYMTISDLQASYDVFNIESAGREFTEAVAHIRDVGAVGLDAEYYTDVIDNANYVAPRYVQFGLEAKCYAFNVVKLSVAKNALREIRDLCASDRLLKVGHSVEEDLRRVFMYFSAKYQIDSAVGYHAVDVRESLFLQGATYNCFSLADLTHRYLGKTLRKNLREISTGGKPELTNELQVEYVALDALVPITLYEKFRDLMMNNQLVSKVICRHSCLSSFVIDWGVWPKIEKLIEIGTFDDKVEVIEMAKSTHKEIETYLEENRTHILVTHDKYLLLNVKIVSKIPFYN